MHVVEGVGPVQVLGEHDSGVKEMLGTFGVQLKPSAFKKDVKPLLKEACTRIFGTATGLVDMMVKHVPSSKAGSATKACPPLFLLSCAGTFACQLISPLMLGKVLCSLICLGVVSSQLHFPLLFLLAGV